MLPGTNRLLEILLVEDNLVDIKLTNETLKDRGIKCNLSVVMDGEEALQFLRQQPPFDAAPRPNLIFLDLNLPRIDGREVLADIKNDEALRRIPVIVLTTSSSEEDVRKAYDLHANCYVKKPVDMLKFIETMTAIDEFWFRTAILPT